MEKLKRFIEEARKEVEEYKRVSRKRAEEAYEVIEKLIDTLKETGLENDLELFECCGLRFVWRGASNIGYWLFLANEEGVVFNPNHVGGSYYIAGNFNAYVECMNAEEMLRTIKKLPDFVDNFYKVINELKKEFEAEQHQPHP